MAGRAVGRRVIAGDAVKVAENADSGSRGLPIPIQTGLIAGFSTKPHGVGAVVETAGAGGGS